MIKDVQHVVNSINVRELANNVSQLSDLVLGGGLYTWVVLDRDMQVGSIRERMVLRTPFLERVPVAGSSHVPNKRLGFIPAYLVVPLFTLGLFCCFSIYVFCGTYSVEISATRDNIRRLSLGLRQIPFTPSSTPANVVSVWDVGVDTVFLRTYIDGVDPVVGTHSGMTVSMAVPRVYVAVVAPMYDGVTHVDTMIQVLTLIAYSSPHTNLRIYVGLEHQEDAHSCYKMFHNKSAPLNTHVEFIVLGMKSRTTLSRRTHMLAAHAFVDMRDANGFILVVHHSCTLSSQLDVRNLAPHGLGFVLVHPPIVSQTLHDKIDSHDLGLTSDPLFTYTTRDQEYRPGTVRRAHTSVLHCSGGLMHAMHHPW